MFYAVRATEPVKRVGQDAATFDFLSRRLRISSKLAWV